MKTTQQDESLKVELKSFSSSLQSKLPRKIFNLTDETASTRKQHGAINGEGLAKCF